MNPDEIVDNLRNALQNFLHVEWLSTVVTVVVVLIITAILAHLLTKFLQKILHVKSNPLPSSSIFINIGRVAVWTIGVCIILSSCFNVNVSAAITALGVGGIAISLGFQSTLSNLIGGLQISLTRLIVPGDNINVGGQQGIVHDVTWRHTVITTVRGERVIIPNSVINTEALIKLPPVNVVRIGIVVTPSDKSLDDITKVMTQAVSKALEGIAVIEQEPQIEYTEITDYGYKGSLTFSIAEGSNIGKVKDVALKAIAEHAHRTGSSHSGSHKARTVQVKKKLNGAERTAAALVETGREKIEKRKEKRKEHEGDKSEHAGENGESRRDAEDSPARDTRTFGQNSGTK